MSTPVEFTVWAPLPGRVRIQVDGAVHDMTREDGGWWRAEVEAGPEADYGFLLDDSDEPRPDPRSRRQPDGVHGLSRRFDPDAHEWNDTAWTGRPLAGGVVYELHIGTFTPEGTLDAAIGRLGHLVRLGVDFVELLPVNAFNGPHNWGYDGVLWYAVQETYGGPAAYQRFVDACHEQGLGVIQDVVYNHLGPSGNYLPEFFPIFAEGGANSWGNCDQPVGAGFRRGTPLRHRQCAHVAARHARRRAAAGRRPRAGRRAGHARARGDGTGGRQAVGRRRPAAEPDRRERPQRPADGHPAGGRRHGPDRAVERRLPPLAARGADR